MITLGILSGLFYGMGASYILNRKPKDEIQLKVVMHNQLLGLGFWVIASVLAISSIFADK